MAKRKNKLAEPHLSQLLDEMGRVRGRLHDFQDHTAPMQDDWKAIDEVRKAIDHLAEKLTTDPEYYYAKTPRV